ncbi:DUF397 domain-containing protein [Streptomonospora algeriensis]|uniref:DUF397 domain-containing protein n=1 Tax=Streptomonospora algeriensis TaxID=995084 RepID=A0ABW3B9T4_9ACTN
MPDQTAWRKSSYSGGRENCVEISLPSWRTSSYSGANNNCVEVADLSGATAVRDSKHPDGAHLTFPATEWAAFLHAMRTERI